MLYRIERIIHSVVANAAANPPVQASVICQVSRAPDVDPTPLTGQNGQPKARRIWRKLYANGPNATWLQGLQPGDTFIVAYADERPGRIVEGESYSRSYMKDGAQQTSPADPPSELHNARVYRVEVSNRQAQEQLARGERVAAQVEQQATAAPSPAAPQITP